MRVVFVMMFAKQDVQAQQITNTHPTLQTVLGAYIFCDKTGQSIGFAGKQSLQKGFCDEWKSKPGSDKGRPFSQERLSFGLDRTRQLLQQQITNLVHIAHNAVIAVVKDRSLRILVDGNDAAGVRESRDVIDRAGNPEAEQQLWLDDRAGLPDHELEREEAAVKNRPRAGELSTEPLRKPAVARDSFGLDGVPDTDDHLSVGQVHTVVRLIWCKVQNRRADPLKRKAPLLVPRFAAATPRRIITEGARTNGTHLGAHHRHGDHGHHFSAHGGFNELDVARLWIVDKLGGI